MQNLAAPTHFRNSEFSLKLCHEFKSNENVNVWHRSIGLTLLLILFCYEYRTFHAILKLRDSVPVNTFQIGIRI